MRRPVVWISAFLALLATLALVLAGCRPGAPSAPSVSALPAQTSTSPAAEYVGNAACEECHWKEFRLHHGGRHDTTLHLAGGMGVVAAPVGPIGDSGYAVTTAGGKFRFVRGTDVRANRQIDYALGSGKAGVTYISTGADQQLTELRMTYFPSRRKWVTTPGQEIRGDLDLGVTHDSFSSRRCLGCHSITVPAGSLRVEEKFAGVGCESCHGPGSAHIAAARIHGNTDLKMEKMGRWNGDQINQTCGRCHRGLTDGPFVGPQPAFTQRFQPYGLAASPCFQKSSGKLTCLTCHDAHSDARKDARFYEEKCLSCHAPAVAGSKPCPVNPKDRCIGCHMPARSIFPGTKLDVKMADHLIWAYRKSRRT